VAGLVLFSYDGSDLAKLAIEEAGRELGAGRNAATVTVWQPFNVGFLPAGGLEIDAKQTEQVRAAAKQTAAEGARLAEAAGFHTEAVEIEAAPTWKGIVEAAHARDASLIVLGSHGRSGLSGVLLGSVAEAVAAHFDRSVLIVHRR
jgi:nucleotide-binding universal stress UspA family protein